MAYTALVSGVGFGTENLGAGWNSMDPGWHWQAVKWLDMGFVG
jgi:hypothetical protein